jgi:uncharacterized protein (UPF0254 family)
MDRLEDQISWYNKNSLRSHFLFKMLKAVVIVCAALIPLLSGLQALALKENDPHLLAKNYPVPGQNTVSSTGFRDEFE